MLITEDRIWAGSETSLRAVLKAEVDFAAKMSSGMVDKNEDAPPRLLSIDDGVATISIKGPLVNSDSPYLEMFGVTGYPEIRAALLDAAKNTEVKQILLDVDSGGGAVSGVADTATLIRTINDKVKPVTAFTDGVAASAAYWLGSSAGSIYAGKTAMVGSVGVIATHKEYVEAYKKEGVGVTVIRAGKEKALANSNEKLSEKGRAQIQQMVDASYGVFVQHVADMRGVSYQVADKQMADGQEFLGSAAKDVGLVDGIRTFDAVVSELKEKVIDTSNKFIDNRAKGGARLIGSSSTTLSGEAIMARKALSEQDVAALAAGVAITDIAAIDATTDAATVTGEAIASTEQPIVEGSSDGTVQAEGQEAAQEVTAEVDTNSATVQLLSSQLQAKDEALLQAGIKLSKLEEKLCEVSATHAPLMQIASKSINNMQIAMGGSALSVEGMSDVAVLAEHTRLSEQFANKFKAGGVSAVVGEDGTATKPQVDPRHLARVNAARFTK